MDPYETEAQALNDLLTLYKQLSENKAICGLVIADELLRTTNPEDAEELSTSAAKKIASLPGVSLLVSTHFQKLQTMAEENPGLFMNKHMDIELNGNNKITNLRYRLTEGVSALAGLHGVKSKRIPLPTPEGSSYF